MKLLFTIVCICSLFSTACTKKTDKDFSGEWIQTPNAEKSMRKLSIEKQGEDYQIKDEFWLDTDSPRPSQSGGGTAVVTSNGTLEYQNQKNIEFQLNETSSQLTLHDKEYDANLIFEKAH